MIEYPIHLCVLISDDPSSVGTDKIALMCEALRESPENVTKIWVSSGGLVGAVYRKKSVMNFEPVVSVNENLVVWVAGKLNRCPDALADDSGKLSAVAFSREYTRCSAGCVRELDGEYVIAVFDKREQSFTIINDRFGSLPSYISDEPGTFAFATGVRALATLPTVSREPDLESIRDMTSFGGFRLGDKTLLRAIKKVPNATTTRVVRGSKFSRTKYWNWNEIQASPETIDTLLPKAHELWCDAMRVRLTNSKHPVVFLSGGLDSRLILAEGIKQAEFSALSYGIQNSDDVEIARTVAGQADIAWTHIPLYSGTSWFRNRCAQIFKTDGLVQLVDLMHFEMLGFIKSPYDCCFSGYGGDAVCGPHYVDVVDAAGLLRSMPYYGTTISRSHPESLELMEEALGELGGARANMAIFTQKYPQSIALALRAANSVLPVQTPFIDYRVFDFWQALSSVVRIDQNAYQYWLNCKYSEFFARIPWQQTGLPIMASKFEILAGKVKRRVRKKIQAWGNKLGIRTQPKHRQFFADEVMWNQPDVERAIRSAVLREESICCDVFGRDKVGAILDRWFQRGAAPAQVVGAMFTYETYHRDLKENLASLSQAKLQADAVFVE